jgi:hypothetical protein
MRFVSIPKQRAFLVVDCIRIIGRTDKECGCRQIILSINAKRSTAPTEFAIFANDAILIGV